MIAQKIAPTTQNAIGLKDTGLFSDTARQAGLPTPIAGLMAELMRGDQGKA